MDRLYKLSFPLPGSALIGLWDCQRCGSTHDAVESWVHIGVGDGQDARIVCSTCATALPSVEMRNTDLAPPASTAPVGG